MGGQNFTSANDRSYIQTSNGDLLVGNNLQGRDILPFLKWGAEMHTICDIWSVHFQPVCKMKHVKRHLARNCHIYNNRKQKTDRKGDRGEMWSRRAEPRARSSAGKPGSRWHKLHEWGTWRKISPNNNLAPTFIFLLSSGGNRWLLINLVKQTFQCYDILYIELFLPGLCIHAVSHNRHSASSWASSIVRLISIHHIFLPLAIQTSMTCDFPHHILLQAHCLRSQRYR